MNRFNVCNEIRCPWSLKSGCDRYSVSQHCHLLNEETRSYIDANQYWLFADTDDGAININQLREENEIFLKDDQRTQRSIELSASGFSEWPQRDKLGWDQ